MIHPILNFDPELITMVEEHSSSSARLNSTTNDYSNSIPAPTISTTSTSSTTIQQEFKTSIDPINGDHQLTKIDNSKDLDKGGGSKIKNGDDQTVHLLSDETRKSTGTTTLNNGSSGSGGGQISNEDKPNGDKIKLKSNDTLETDAELVCKDNNNMTISEINSSPARDNHYLSPADSHRTDSPKPGCSNQLEIDSSSPRSARSSDNGGNPDDLLALLPSPSNFARPSSVIRRLRQENERLQAEVVRLRRLVVSGATGILSELKPPSLDGSTSGESPATTNSMEMELLLAKEALLTLKADKRRLKAEKYDLLSQMKQLFSTLEDKETELREFIRTYGQRVRDETSLQQLSTEREERERERWSLLRHARDEAERSLSLAAQLNAKELQLQQAQEQLVEARRQLAISGCLSDQESLASLPRHSVNGGVGPGISGVNSSGSGPGGGPLTPGSGIGILSSGNLGLLPGDRGSCSADSGVRVSSDRESGGATSITGNLSDSTTDGAPTITVESTSSCMRDNIGDNMSIVSAVPPPPPPVHLYQTVSTKDCSPTLSPLNVNNFPRNVETNNLSRSVEQLSSPLEQEPINLAKRNKHPNRISGRGGTWGSISRVFARAKHRSKTSSLQETSEHPYESYRSWSPLTEEGYAEKLRLLREASTIPMDRWRAPTVLAWLEVALGMPQYGARCAENIKSGKISPLNGQVLLELSDIELECGLEITHPMHRKKLRLAIEEHRHPALVRYPAIAQLGHTWVSSEWLPDLGLSQYSENFASNMVDARMLEHLSKKELEKYLGVTRKFHQASIVHGIHLLRVMKYDRQTLALRRHQCETIDADPLVWTNQRFIRWARSIDLSEYADNLKDSGVHGGLVVLETSFNGDTMATALGIPTSKNIIRRHLNAELEALILPARSTLVHYVRVRSKQKIPGNMSGGGGGGGGGGSLGRSYSKSCVGLTGAAGAAATMQQNFLKNSPLFPLSFGGDSKRMGIKGSLSRALGFTSNKPKLLPTPPPVPTASALMPTTMEKEKPSPTSSSENSSVKSRISPPLIYFSSGKSSKSGGESPIYAQPFMQQHHHNHHYHQYHQYQQQPKKYLYQRRSEDYDMYICSSIDEYDISRSIQSIRSENDSTKSPKDIFMESNVRGVNKMRHRRVKSISDIDSLQDGIKVPI